MSLIPSLGRQREADLCKLETVLLYIVNSRTAIAAKLYSMTQSQK
jgi:nicotinic acid phosphoribosyltransferase